MKVEVDYAFEVFYKDYLKMCNAEKVLFGTSDTHKDFEDFCNYAIRKVFIEELQFMASFLSRDYDKLVSNLNDLQKSVVDSAIPIIKYWLPFDVDDLRSVKVFNKEFPE